MLRASEGWKGGPSAGNGILGGSCELRRVQSWGSAGAFGRGEAAIEFGRDPPVSESRFSSSGVRILPTRQSRQILSFVAEALAVTHRVQGVESPGLFLIQAGDVFSLVSWFVRGFTSCGTRIETSCLKILTTCRGCLVAPSPGLH